MRWHPLVKEYGPEKIYINCLDNIAAEALLHLCLSNLPTKNDWSTFNKAFMTTATLAATHIDTNVSELIPLLYTMPHKYQRKDKVIKTKCNTCDLQTQSFRWAGGCNIELASHNSKINVLKPLRKHVID